MKQYKTYQPAFERNEADNISQKRELYEEKQESVPVHFEMDSNEAYKYFNKLPQKMLPPLPHGHQWIKQNGRYSIIKDKNAIEHRIDIIIYGPSNGLNPHINYLCQTDKKTTFSLAKTLPNNNPGEVNYPMINTDYLVSNFSYDQPGMFKNHSRGHLIDHQDTIIRAGYSNSSTDPRNFVPEPPTRAWGMNFRNHKIKQLRNNGGGYYVQHNEYDTSKYKTKNRTQVPNHVRLYTYDNRYHSIDLHHVDWTENLDRPNKKQTYVKYYQTNLSSSFASAPIVQYYDANSTNTAFRYHARELFKKSQDIGDAHHQSRFVKRDRANAAGEAGNVEFETKSKLVNSAVKLFDVNKSKTSLNEMRRSIQHMNGLNELTDGTTYRATTKEKGLTFFREVNESNLAATDIESLEDAFRQHCRID